MPAPIYSLSVTGTDPKETTRESHEAAINAALGEIFVIAEDAEEAASGAQSAVSNIDLSRLGQNRVTNSDWLGASAGSVSLTDPGSYSNFPIEGWNVFRTTAAGYSFPSEVEIVDNQWSGVTGLSRAVRLRMVRASSGTLNSDFQPRQLYAIPPGLLGSTSIPIRLVYAYKMASASIDLDAVFISKENDEPTGGSLLAATQESVDVVGEWAFAVFSATVTDPAAQFVVAGPRVRTNPPSGGYGGATSNVDENFFLGAVLFDFDRAPIKWEQPPEEAVDRRVAKTYDDQLFNPLRAGQNLVRNAVFNADEIGATSDPSDWGTTFAGSGVVKAAFEIVEVDFDVPAQAIEATHYNTGSERTELQLVQSVSIPPELVGDIAATARVVQSFQRSSLLVEGTLTVIPRDEGGNSLGLVYPSRIGAAGGVGELVSYAYDAPITYETATTLELRFRVSMRADSGVVSGITTKQTGMSCRWNVHPLELTYDRNLDYDMGLSATQAAEEVIASVASAGLVSSYDTYLDPLGNMTRAVPTTQVLALGDSQTDSFDDELDAALSSRVVTDAGIGGETSTHVLARMKGHSADTAYHAGLAWTTGTKRLKSIRAVPPRCIVETYRSFWSAYGMKVAEPEFVEFHNDDGFIGRSYDQLTSNATASGDTLTASGHPWVNGDEVYVLQASRPSNMYQGKVYYVRDRTSTTFKLAEFSGGAAISFNSFGASIAVLGGFYFDWAFTTGQDNTIRTETYTNWSGLVPAVCVGTNDIAFAGDPADAPAIAKANIEATVKEFRTLFKRFVISTIPGFYPWTIGSDEYAAMVNINSWILQLYPQHSVDAYAMLLANGDGSTNDNADIASGLVPRSLRLAPDDGHINTAGNLLRAEQIADFITLRAW